MMMMMRRRKRIIGVVHHLPFPPRGHHQHHRYGKKIILHRNYHDWMSAMTQTFDLHSAALKVCLIEMPTEVIDSQGVMKVRCRRVQGTITPKLLMRQHGTRRQGKTRNKLRAESYSWLEKLFENELADAAGNQSSFLSNPYLSWQLNFYLVHIRLKMLTKQVDDAQELRKQLSETVSDLQRQLKNEREENKKSKKRYFFVFRKMLSYYLWLLIVTWKIGFVSFRLVSFLYRQ